MSTFKLQESFYHFCSYFSEYLEKNIESLRYFTFKFIFRSYKSDLVETKKHNRPLRNCQDKSSQIVKAAKDFSHGFLKYISCPQKKRLKISLEILIVCRGKQKSNTPQ